MLLLAARMANIPLYSKLTRSHNAVGFWPSATKTEFQTAELLPGSVRCGQSHNNYIWYTLPHTNKQCDNSLYFGPKCWIRRQSSLKIVYYWASSAILEIGWMHRTASDAAELVCLSHRHGQIGSPQGPAEVCRLCRFLLEIILPLVSSRFLPINNRSPADIQSSVSEPFPAVWTHSTTSEWNGGPRMHKTTTVRKIQRIATILEIWQAIIDRTD